MFQDLSSDEQDSSADELVTNLSHISPDLPPRIYIPTSTWIPTHTEYPQ